MPYISQDTTIGVANFWEVTPVPNAIRDLPFVPGATIAVYDAAFGIGEMVYARAGAGIRLYGLCVLTPTWAAGTFSLTMDMTEHPGTANLGRQVYVYQGTTAATVGQYAWFMRRGVTPVNCAASVAAGVTIGTAATAGQATTNGAGRQLLNAVVATPATNTVVRAGTGVISDSLIFFAGGTQGLFAGGYLSGTGVGSAAIIAEVFPDRVRATIVNSAAVTGNVTMTNNNATIFYNLVSIDEAFSQGAIT